MKVNFFWGTTHFVHQKKTVGTHSGIRFQSCTLLLPPLRACPCSSQERRPKSLVRLRRDWLHACVRWCGQFFANHVKKNCVGGQQFSWARSMEPWRVTLGLQKRQAVMCLSVERRPVSITRPSYSFPSWKHLCHRDRTHDGILLFIIRMKTALQPLGRMWASSRLTATRIQWETETGCCRRSRTAGSPFGSVSFLETRPTHKTPRPESRTPSPQCCRTTSHTAIVHTAAASQVIR